MSASSEPPELPPDSPGSSVSSRLQNEFDDLLRRAVLLPNGTLTTKATMNEIILAPGRRTPIKKITPVTDLIDLSTPGTHRTESTQFDNETQRPQHDHIPSLRSLLSIAAISSNEQKPTTTDDCDDPIAHHLLRYSELMTADLESKPITEKMDHWYLDLKKNLMNEFDKLRLQFLEEAQQHALREKQAQAKEYVRLNQDIKTMREMLIKYEHTIDQKDQAEKNLNKALDLLYNKTIAYRRYYEWRTMCIERRRHEYSLALAKRFYEEKLKRRALSSWKSMVEREWKQRFEYACEKKAKAVLVELGNDFELKYKQLELQLLRANEEISRLKVDKNDHDEALKKAFMRGVCALNLEAMSVFVKNDQQPLELTKDEHRRRYHSQHSSGDEQVLDEGVILTGSSKTSTTGDEDNGLKCSSHHHTFPTHVYKECLPSTIYRTGEARTVRQNGVNSAHRHVTFRKRPPITSSRPRHTNSTILVERHAPASNIRS